MARARNIKPGFYMNEELAKCSLLSRYIFPGLWIFADREGRLEDRPLRLKASIIPYDDADMDLLLTELHTKGFITRYAVNGEKFIQINKFIKHQNPHKDEKVSSIPAPELQSTCTVQVPELHGTLPASLLPLVTSYSSKPLTPKSAVSDYPEPFIEAWNAYPSRPGSSKVDAFKQWKARIAEGESPAVIAEGVTRYAAYCLAMKTERNFIKMPATFFGRGKHYLSDWTPVETQGKEKSNADSRADVIAAFTGRRRESTLQGAIEGDYRTVESG